MMDFSALPQAIDILTAGISVHGTGFDREALVPSILVIGFFLWCMKGAPVNEKASGGFTLGWVILLAFPALADAATAPTNPDGAAIWAIMATVASMALIKAYANGRPLIALALAVFLFVGAVGALTNAARADLWESDGERAVKEAQAESIRLEAQARYKRELALLRSSGHAPPPPDDESPVLIWLIFGIAIAAIGWAYIENRWRERRDLEIRELQYRLSIAENRQRENIRIPFHDFARREIER